MYNKVPNKFPKINNSNYRIAFVGEAPGRDEEVAGEPFVGVSGRLLKAKMSSAGIQPDACFFGNVTQCRPPANEIEAFAWDGEEIQEGLTQLKKDLVEYNPWLVVLLGKTALYAASERSDITNQRGSLFVCNRIESPMFSFKCMSTYHPAACLRMYEWTPIFSFDMRRAAEEGKTHFLSLPQRDCIIAKDANQVTEYLSNLQRTKTFTSNDIEGYVGDMQCIGIAPSAREAFVIPFKGSTGESYFDEEQELQVWRALANFLEDPNCGKVFQNGLYDRFIIQYSYQIVCRGNVDDTMLKWHELYCELPKGLDTQASLLTKEPFWKHERKTDSWEVKMKYCGKDACVTYEINDIISQKLPSFYGPASVTHYLFNRDLLNPLLYMELRGILYDTTTAKARRADVLEKMYTAQYELDALTEHGHGCSDETTALNAVRELMCYKRNPSQIKAPYADSYPRALKLIAQEGTLHPKSETEKGASSELSCLLERHLNTDSPKFTKYLYEKLKLPIQINKRTKQPTSDYMALLRLWKRDTPHKAILEHAITIRDTSTREGMLAIHADTDGRIRCAYNAVGTNTGRLTCYTSPTGSGYNLQTIPKKDRDLFVADEGHYLFQCDLSGADGWTIAAHCKNLGDSTMLDDYTFGLKPAKILCLMLRHGTGVNLLPREELKEMSKKVSGDDWDYFACKVGIWGVCYLMGARLLGEQFFMLSEGKLAWSEGEVQNFKRTVFVRYHGVLSWHEQTKRRLSKSKTLTAACGLTRRFFGREEESLGEALSFECQANTTWSTNAAVLKLWNDNENRIRPFMAPRDGVQTLENADRLPCKLKVEPLHQIHDALLGQFQKTDTSWAVSKIKSWFNNPLVIANQQITIPYEGQYGESWGKLNEGTI